MPMARAAVAAGADGLMVEAHPDPPVGPLRRPAVALPRRLCRPDGAGPPRRRGRRPDGRGGAAGRRLGACRLSRTSPPEQGAIRPVRRVFKPPGCASVPGRLYVGALVLTLRPLLLCAASSVTSDSARRRTFSSRACGASSTAATTPPASPSSTASCRSARRRARSTGSRSMLAANPLHGHGRDGAHALGDARRADRRQRAPARVDRRPLRDDPQRHHRELRPAPRAAPREGPHVQVRDRHRGARPPHRPDPAGDRAAARRVRPAGADAGRRRVRHRGREPRRAGPARRRPQRLARCCSASARARTSSRATPARSSSSRATSSTSPTARWPSCAATATT